TECQADCTDHYRSTDLHDFFLLVCSVRVDCECCPACESRLALRFKFCAHDVALWRAADKIEREAGHQGDAGNPGGSEYGRVVRLDDGQFDDPVCQVACARIDVQFILYRYVFQLAKEAVAVGRNSDVSTAVSASEAGKWRGSFDEARTAVEIALAGARIDRYLELERRDAQDSLCGILVCATFCERRNALRRP